MPLTSFQRFHTVERAPGAKRSSQTHHRTSKQAWMVLRSSNLHWWYIVAEAVAVELESAPPAAVELSGSRAWQLVHEQPAQEQLPVAAAFPMLSDQCFGSHNRSDHLQGPVAQSIRQEALGSL